MDVRYSKLSVTGRAVGYDDSGVRCWEMLTNSSPMLELLDTYGLPGTVGKGVNVRSHTMWEHTSGKSRRRPPQTRPQWPLTRPHAGRTAITRASDSLRPMQPPAPVAQLAAKRAIGTCAPHGGTPPHAVCVTMSSSWRRHRASSRRVLAPPGVSRSRPRATECAASIDASATAQMRIATRMGRVTSDPREIRTGERDPSRVGAVTLVRKMRKDIRMGGLSADASSSRRTRYRIRMLTRRGKDDCALRPPSRSACSTCY